MKRLSNLIILSRYYILKLSRDRDLIDFIEILREGLEVGEMFVYLSLSTNREDDFSYFLI